MTLETTLRHQLEHLEAGGFHVNCGNWTVTLVSERGDSLSCALKELTLQRDAPNREELRAWGERIADSASGLMEPLRVVEVDNALGKALLRSDAPVVKDGKASYYELLLERSPARTSACLKRYAADRSSGEAREAVPFVLTHDAIVKLAIDIAGTN